MMRSISGLGRSFAALVALAAVGCGGEAPVEVDAEAAARAEVSGAASGITLFVRPEVAVRADGALTVFGRASKDLTSVSAAVDGVAVGSVRRPSVRRFELVVARAEAERVLAGAPIELALEATAGRERRYVAQVALAARHVEQSGPRATVVEPALAPISVGGQLVFRSRFRIGASDTISRARVEVAGAPVPIVREGARGFRFDLTPSALLTAMDDARDRVAISARSTKLTRLSLAVAGVEVRVASAPFPAVGCLDATRACVAGAVGDDLEACGTYAAVLRCASAPAPACSPLVASAVSDCVYMQLESAASDAEAAPLGALQALENCAAEGDLFGPLFDGVCASDASTPGCGCVGQADCLERFVAGPLAACVDEVRPRFDCAFGLTFRDLTRSPTVYVAERTQRTRAQVTDPLTQAQVLAAARVAYTEAATVDAAFASVDQGVVNVLHVWEGTRGEPYTVIEYGAGDNSYGGVFAYGSDALLVQIQDGDLYRAGNPPSLGCGIPAGSRWGACTETASCGANARCEGLVRTFDPSTGTESITAPGKCVARAEATTSPRADAPCDAVNVCPLADGLACSALDGTSGLCRPAWMFGRVRFPFFLPVPARALVEHPIVVSGLATVPEQAQLEASISAPDLTRVRISMVNPSGTSVVVFDGPRLGAAGVTALLGGTSGERRLDVRVPVPGDESVNGTWRLVVDTRAERAGLAGYRAVVDATLTLSSRYD